MWWVSSGRQNTDFFANISVLVKTKIPFSYLKKMGRFKKTGILQKALVWKS